MNHRILLVAAGSLLALGGAFAAACSSESVEPTGASAADASGDGSTVTVPDGGGAPVDDGASPFTPDTGAPDAGACTASDPLFTSGFHATCATCVAQNCCAEVKGCEGVADCKAYAQCFAACKGDGGSSPACQTSCIAGKDGGAVQAPYNALVLCGGSKCNNDGGPSAPRCPF